MGKHPEAVDLDVMQTCNAIMPLTVPRQADPVHACPPREDPTSGVATVWGECWGLAPAHGAQLMAFAGGVAPRSPPGTPGASPCAPRPCGAGV